MRQRRGLKWRAEKATRSVPIPPEYVAILRRHLEEFGTDPTGRLFRGRRGGPLPAEEYPTVWRKARKQALTPQQAASPLVARPYDLRHAGVSLALNTMPATEAARRAGQSVAVLLAFYAKCIYGDEALWNERFERALAPRQRPVIPEKISE